MNRIEKRDYYNNLLEIYGELLSERQRSILYDTLSLDLSLSEIALSYHITRSGVNDTIKKGMMKLDFYENKLKIYVNNLKKQKIINEIKEKTTQNEIKKLIKDWEEVE